MGVRLVAVVILIMAAAGGLSAQAQEPNLDAYDNAVRVYVSGGDLTTAVTALEAFTCKHFDAAVARVIASGDRHLIEAAAVFQLEVGIGASVASPTTASGHLGLAGSFSTPCGRRRVNVGVAGSRRSNHSAAPGSGWRPAHSFRLTTSHARDPGSERPCRCCRGPRRYEPWRVPSMTSKPRWRIPISIRTATSRCARCSNDGVVSPSR